MKILKNLHLQCKKCGKIWDSDGCRVSIVPGVFYETEEFICGGCE